MVEQIKTIVEIVSLLGSCAVSIFVFVEKVLVPYMKVSPITSMIINYDKCAKFIIWELSFLLVFSTTGVITAIILNNKCVFKDELLILRWLVPISVSFVMYLFAVYFLSKREELQFRKNVLLAIVDFAISIIYYMASLKNDSWSIADFFYLSVLIFISVTQLIINARSQQVRKIKYILHTEDNGEYSVNAKPIYYRENVYISEVDGKEKGYMLSIPKSRIKYVEIIECKDSKSGVDITNENPNDVCE